jgi:steroid 5-alpha reductase family enzyme
MMSPILYNSRDLSDTSSGWFATLGTVLAWTGAVFEAVADGQKMAVKFQTKNEATNAEKATFVGPTGVTYRICRHPNYFAELLYWFGLLVAGMPSFKKSIIAWTASLLGMYGIYGIMTNATKRLDKKQMETYSGQELYEAWRKQVKAPIFPFIYSDKPE